MELGGAMLLRNAEDCRSAVEWIDRSRGRYGSAAVSVGGLGIHFLGSVKLIDARLGDWIIRDRLGRFYACRPLE